MRIFLFLPQLPEPPHSGGRIVTGPLVSGLAEKHEVFLFSLEHGFEGEAEGRKTLSEKVTGVFTAPAAPRISPTTILRAGCSRLPYKVHRFWSSPLARKARDLARSFPPEAIHCENFYTALYAKSVDAPRKVLYKENYEARLLKRWEERTRNPALRALIRVERHRTQRFELESTLWFDEVATISPEDEKLLRGAANDLPGISPHLRNHLRTVRPSIDLDYYSPDSIPGVSNPFGSEKRKNLLVTGSFNYYANVDGALWLVNEVLPRLREPEISLWFVGQRPDPKVRDLHDPPRVYVTGSVPDVRPYFRFADLSLVPLRIGGGIRLKILESLAMGCPFVSTSVGCEGLWNETDPPVWEIADSPEDFAHSAEKILNYPPPRDLLRNWVCARFSPARFVEEMERLYFA